MKDFLTALAMAGRSFKSHHTDPHTLTAARITTCCWGVAAAFAAVAMASALWDPHPWWWWLLQAAIFALDAAMFRWSLTGWVKLRTQAREREEFDRIVQDID